MLSDAERSLLLLCARQQLSANEAERARELLQQPLSWPGLTEMAWRHGVASLLFRNLQALAAVGAAASPGSHLLRQCYVRTAFRNETHYAAITEIVERTNVAGIEIVLLKGAGLARALYLDPALRPFADIDLLVPNDQVEESKQLLQGMRYQLAPDLLSEHFNRAYHSNLPLVRLSPRPVHIELHWQLTDPFSLTAFDHAALFARSRPLPMAGHTAAVLRAEDHFVYLATHLDNHGYLNRIILEGDASLEFPLDELSGDRLIWFTDLHELIGAGLDWNEVLASARMARASDPLAVSLRLLKALLGTTIPESVFEQLPLPAVRWPERRIGKYVFSLRGKKLAAARFQRRFLATKKGFELRLIRLMDLWQYVFPPRTAVNRFYPVHVCAALGQCGKMFFELICRRTLRIVRARNAA